MSGSVLKDYNLKEDIPTTSIMDNSAEAPIKTRAQSTQGLAAIKAGLLKTKLESRRSRTPEGTPISYSALKGRSEETKTRNPRDSRSFSDPDISGSLVIFAEANGLFSRGNQCSSSFKVNTKSKSIDMPTDRPMFIDQDDKAKDSVKNLASSFERCSVELDSTRHHMTEFTNPLHRGNQPRFRKGGGVLPTKPPVAPKPVIAPKPPVLPKSPAKPTIKPRTTTTGQRNAGVVSQSKPLTEKLPAKNTTEQANESINEEDVSESQSHESMNNTAKTQHSNAAVVDKSSESPSGLSGPSENNIHNDKASLQDDMSKIMVTGSPAKNVSKQSNVTIEGDVLSKSPPKIPVLTNSPDKNTALQKGETAEGTAAKASPKSVFSDDDDDDGMHAKVSHAKPDMPLRPPPRKPTIYTEHKELDAAINGEEKDIINNEQTQQKQPETENQECVEAPLYAQVDKSKKKSHLKSINSDLTDVRKTRSESDPSPYNVNISTGVKFEVIEEVCSTNQAIMENEIDEVVSEDESEDGWDPEDFDDDDDSSDFDNDNSRPNSEGGTMQFPDQNSKKLYNIAYEILTTERAYVRRLHLLDKVFYFRLQNECLSHGHITADVLPDIFSNIASIHSFHKDFLLPKLEERMSKWSTDDRIGDILKTLAPFLKLYTAYIANFDKSSETLAIWTKKSPKFAAIIEEIQKSKECENLTLGHHMLEPIQRVPRYKLLSRDYLSKLSEDSPDYKDTQGAMEIISAAAMHANDSMKKTEKFKKLLELQERVIDDYDLITAGRQFVKEGELTKVAARHATHQERTLLLFNDVLLCCAKLPGTNKLKVKVEMDLYGMEIGEADEDVELTNTFRVTSKQKVIDFSAATEDDRETWVTKINQAIQEISLKRESYKRGSQTNKLSDGQLGIQAPAWVRDEAVTMCMSCDCLFTLTRRRHHCRACGAIYCHSCSHFKASLEYSGKIERVCQHCHKLIVRDDKASSVKKSTEEQRYHDVRKISRDSKVIMSGYLSHKSGKGWVKRWCVLSDTFEFYCYKAKKDQKADFSLPLPGYVVDKPNLADNLDKKIAFKLHHKNVVVYFFATDNQDRLERWIHNLSYAVKAERIPEEDTADLPVTKI